MKKPKTPSEEDEDSFFNIHFDIRDKMMEFREK
jgi:hypothetical protein